MTVADVLSSEEVQQFLGALISRQVLSLRARPTVSIKPLVTPTEARELIRTTSLDSNWVQQVKAGATKPLIGTNDRSVDLDATLRSYADGFSLRLSAVQRRSQSITEICSELERVLSSAGCSISRGITANVYMTPPGSQGLGAHYDNHDVLVVQCVGEKHWTLFKNRAPLSTKSQNRPPDEPLEEDQQLLLRSGDVLFLPRGVFHQAKTTDRDSLHITFGIYTATWLDFCLPLLSEQPCMHEALAPSLSDVAAVQGLRERMLAALDSLARITVSTPRASTGSGPSLRS
jgi:ribosomal protein L16 Arg81 hydroxylase